ncbi:MAG: PH domain-containing protein [Ruminococcus sp.]|nr:PH domain-containing protein [Ruminococcus sp.]
MSRDNSLRGFFRKRQHPVKIISYIAKYLWLLVIPLGKYLIATRFDFESWVRTNWVDILTLSVIIGYGFLRWVFIYFEIEEDCVVVHTGYFGIATTRVYFSEMSTVSLCQGYFYRMIRACTLYIDTDAKSLQRADITFDLSQKQAFYIYELATKRCRGKPRYIFNAPKKSMVIFSLLFSSTLSGMLLTLTFIYEAYRIVGRETEELLFRTVNDTLEKLTLHIPKYLFFAAMIVAGSWLISFISNLMRHWNFNCTRCVDFLLINSGKGTKRRHVLMRDRVNYIDTQQSMLMKFFGICSVAVQCTGYGKRRLEISALIPITTRSTAQSSLKLLLPGVPEAKYDVRTGWKDLGRFITMPIVLCFVPWTAYLVLCRVIPGFEKVVTALPDWQQDLRNLAVISMLPLIWLLVVKYFAVFETAVGFDKGHCMISYCRFYRFHQTVLSVDRISKIVILQNPFQKLSRTCHLKIYANSEKVSCHTVKGLDYKKVCALLEENGYM